MDSTRQWATLQHVVHECHSRLPTFCLVEPRSLVAEPAQRALLFQGP